MTDGVITVPTATDASLSKCLNRYVHKWWCKQHINIPSVLLVSRADDNLTIEQRMHFNDP